MDSKLNPSMALHKEEENTELFVLHFTPTFGPSYFENALAL